MRKSLLLALALVVALGVTLAGCGQKAGADLVTCAACGGKVEPAAVKDVNGQKVCVACAEKMEAAKAPAGPDQDGLLTCVACGMKMAPKDMVTVDGKTYCAHCVPEGAAKPTEGQDAGHAGGA